MKIRIEKDSISKGSKKMTRDELQLHLQMKRGGARTFKDKTKYSRKEKHKAYC